MSRIDWRDIEEDPITYTRGISYTGGDWVQWTPTLTGSTTSPTGYTSNGYYTIILGMAVVTAHIVVGASWSAGSGFYAIPAPVNPAPMSPGYVNYAGSGYLYDASTDDPYTFHVQANATGNVLNLIATGTQSAVTGTYPFTFAVNDRIHFKAEYPIL